MSKDKKTLDGIRKFFEEHDIPVPEDFQDHRQLTDAEVNLVHVLTDHLYRGVVSELRQAKDELESVLLQDDPRAQAVTAHVTAALESITNTLNEVHTEIPGMPDVPMMDKILEKLREEIQRAAMLHATNNIPPEQMH